MKQYIYEIWALGYDKNYMCIDDEKLLDLSTDYDDALDKFNQVNSYTLPNAPITHVVIEQCYRGVCEDILKEQWNRGDINNE